jgi:hypothetical protein
MTTRVWLPLVTVDGVGETAWSSPGTTADLFTRAGDLTITAVSDGRIVQHFHHAHWLRCTVYDDDGHPDFSFTNPRYGVAGAAAPSVA